VGIGSDPWTTLELAQIAAAPLIAIDVDEKRVERARAEGIDARVANLTIGERAILVRAINVLRGQPEIPDAHGTLASSLVDGGMLLEGTSDAAGAVLTAWVIRPNAMRERLLFLTDFSRGFAPALFWDHLPRDLRRDAKPGTAIRDLLDRWTAACREARAAGRREPADSFRESAGATARPSDFVGEGFLEVAWPP
jgi:hypothetical protein